MKLYEEFREFETMWEAVDAANTPRYVDLYVPRTSTNGAALQRKVAQLEGVEAFEITTHKLPQSFVNAARTYAAGEFDGKAYTDQAGMDEIAAKIQDKQILNAITVITP